jgi:hypothetical protein
MTLPTSPASRSLVPPRLRALVAATFVLVALLAAAVSCGPNKVEVARDRLESSLAVLADSGDVEALRMIADIEVLRATGMFSDSVANALTAMPTKEFFAMDEKGVRARSGRGEDITTLLAYTSQEPMLLKEAVITPEQAAEVRRMAIDNMTAAAEMATSYGAGRAHSTAATPRAP